MYFFLLIVCSILTATTANTEDTNLTIQGSYSGVVSVKGATCIITIPDLSLRTLGNYAKQKPSTNNNGFLVDFWVDAASKSPQYRLYLFQDEWTLRKPSKTDQYDIELVSGAIKNNAQFARIGVTVEFPISKIEGKIIKATNARDRRDYSKNQAAKGVISLTTMTIRQGIASQYPGDFSKNPVYTQQCENAKKAGLDLNTVLDHNFTAFCNGQYFFMLYYNLAQVSGSNIEYLLQRVKITKTYLDQKGNKIKPDKVQYLVEALKLDTQPKNETSRPTCQMLRAGRCLQTANHSGNRNRGR